METPTTIALDTNILARFYVDDPSDSEAQKQRPIAHRLFHLLQPGHPDQLQQLLYSIDSLAKLPVFQSA